MRLALYWMDVMHDCPSSDITFSNWLASNKIKSVLALGWYSEFLLKISMNFSTVFVSKWDTLYFFKLKKPC